MSSQYNLSTYNLRTTADFIKAKFTGYKGFKREDLIARVHLILKTQKYIIYILSVIYFKTLNRGLYKILNKRLYHLSKSDLMVSIFDIQLYLKMPMFLYRFSMANYGFWEEKFSQSTFPLLLTYNKNEFSTAYEFDCIRDQSPHVPFVIPNFVHWESSFRHVLGARKTDLAELFIKHGNYNVAKIYHTTITDQLTIDDVEDFKCSKDWNLHGLNSSSSITEAFSLFVTGYSKFGRPSNILLQEQQEKMNFKFNLKREKEKKKLKLRKGIEKTNSELAILHEQNNSYLGTENSSTIFSSVRKNTIKTKRLLARSFSDNNKKSKNQNVLTSLATINLDSSFTSDEIDNSTELTDFDNNLLPRSPNTLERSDNLANSPYRYESGERLGLHMKNDFDNIPRNTENLTVQKNKNEKENLIIYH